MARYIDADAVRLAKVPYDEELSEYERGWNAACDEIAADAPTADVVERKTGKWIYHEAYKGARFGFLECSCCGEKVWLRTDEPYKFCRKCGAEMEANDGNN